MAADQSVDGFLAAVIGDCLRGDVQQLEQNGDHGVAVVAGAAGGGVLDGVAGSGVSLQLIDVGNAALGVGQDHKLGNTHTDQRRNIVQRIVDIDKAGSQGE